MSADRYAVVGHPVAHSLSPRIHQAFGRQLGIALEYGAIDCPTEQLPDRVAAFAADGGRGLNVTLPHKRAAHALCTELGPTAQRCGVVNTMAWTGDGWRGHNTDGSGLVRDLTERRRQDLRGRKVLLIGAGGAAHGVAPALLDAGISALFIVNRTDARTDALADLLADPARVHPRYYEDMDDLGPFDLVINATSMGHDAGDGDPVALPGKMLTPRTDVVDLSYGRAAVGFLAWARAAGADRLFDGLGMLVEQAADSFRIWHGKRPYTDEVYEDLRKEFGSPLASG